jgi:hypothetical protein
VLSLIESRTKNLERVNAGSLNDRYGMGLLSALDKVTGYDDFMCKTSATISLVVVMVFAMKKDSDLSTM